MNKDMNTCRAKRFNRTYSIEIWGGGKPPRQLATTGNRDVAVKVAKGLALEAGEIARVWQSMGVAERGHSITYERTAKGEIYA